jgi:NDP-sugar pyrophosphorylase family protein
MAKAIINVILLCGGRGTRLADVTKDKIPKSLYAIDDMELIKYSVNMLESSVYIDKLIFAVDHRSDKMTQWVNEQNFKTNVAISKQGIPGVVAAVRSALPYVASEQVIVCNTDEIRDGFNVDYFIENSMKVVEPNEGVMATATADNLYRHRVINTDENNRIIYTTLKGDTYLRSPNLVGVINIGFILLPRYSLNKLDERYGNDWSSIIDPLVEQRKLYVVHTPSVKYFNVGTLSEVDDAMKYFAN